MVHTVVARLRRQFGRQLVHTHDIGYLLDPATDTDEDESYRLLEDARRLLDQRSYDEAARRFRAALDLWRTGDAYGGVSDALVTAERAGLAEQRAQVSEELISLLVDRLPAALAEAGDRAGQLIVDFPLRERPYQLAMLTAYRRGRQAEALAGYAQLRTRLGEELGVDPGAASTALHAAILRQDPALDLPETARARAPARLRASCLPEPTSPLIARETELDAVTAALESGRRLITLVGPGGVGKSRLLTELGRRWDRSRVVYTDLSGLTGVGTDDLADMLALTHQIAVNGAAAIDAIVASMADQDYLSLVDEAEWVSDAVGRIAEAVLEGCPQVRIVVTSRRPLDVPGEHVITVLPLELPVGTAGVAQTLEAPAIRLLVERLADRGLRIEPDRASAQLVTEIAAGVDGLPLGLELVAAHAGSRSLDDLVALVRSPLDVATTRRRGDRQGSLRETVRWSNDRLDPAHRRLLSRLSVFAGPFDIDAARAVAGPFVADLDAAVAALVRDALLIVDRTGPARLRFRSCERSASSPPSGSSRATPRTPGAGTGPGTRPGGEADHGATTCWPTCAITMTTTSPRWTRP